MSTVITPFQGTDPFSTATFNNRISQINTGFSYISNPNLLDNWYFGNPVNQRGQTEYTKAGYAIDRWKFPSIGSTEPSLTIVYGGLTIAYGLYQYLDEHVTKGILGKNVTVSTLVAGGTLFCNSFDISESERLLYPVDVNSNGVSRCLLVVDPSNFQGCFLRIEPSTNGSLSDTILSIKFELGSTQTLAHQDENGKWQLNEIPDYGEQLARCQRYFVNFNPYKMPWFAMPPAVASNGVQAYSAVTLPVSMRAQPVVAYGGNIVLSQDANHAVTSISVSDNTFTGNSIQLRYEVSAGTLTANSLYRVQGNNDQTAYIWLSADL